MPHTEPRDDRAPTVYAPDIPNVVIRAGASAWREVPRARRIRIVEFACYLALVVAAVSVLLVVILKVR